MTPKKSIEEHVRSEFSDWSPLVPASVKANVDKALFSPKKKRGLWFWLFTPLFFVLLGVLVYAYSNRDKQTTQQISISSASINGSQASSILHPKYSNEASNSDHSASIITESEISIDVESNHRTPQTNNLQQPSSDATIFPSPSIEPKNELSNVNSSNWDNIISNQNDESTQAHVHTNTPENDLNQVGNTAAESQNPVSDTTKVNAQVSASDTNALLTAEIEHIHIAEDSLHASENNELPTNSAISRFFIGGVFSVLQGNNTWSNSGNQITEERSLHAGLEFGFKLNKSLAIVSGFEYQQRIEYFETQNLQVDSNFSGYEMEFIYEPNNPVPIDSVLVEVFSYDSTFTNWQNRATWRQIGLPLILDWTIIERSKFSVGMQFGTVLGLSTFRSYDFLNFPVERWTQFSNQWLARPYVFYHLGPWRLGLHVSTQYDLVLPSTWGLENRRRFAFGLGLGIRYQFGQK